MAIPESDLPVLGFDYLRAAQASRSPILAALDAEGIEDLALRYRKFLALKARHPETPIAPSEIIDEMWHLHMLHPRAYYHDCMALFGFILDHKPGYGNTPETRPALERVFETTAALWEAEFGEPYCVPGMKFHNVIICADEEEEEPKPKPQPKPKAPAPEARFLH